MMYTILKTFIYLPLPCMAWLYAVWINFQHQPFYLLWHTSSSIGVVHLCHFVPDLLWKILLNCTVMCWLSLIFSRIYKIMSSTHGNSWINFHVYDIGKWLTLYFNTYRPNVVYQWKSPAFIDIELQLVKLCSNPLDQLTIKFTTM